MSNITITEAQPEIIYVGVDEDINEVISNKIAAYIQSFIPSGCKKEDFQIWEALSGGVGIIKAGITHPIIPTKLLEFRLVE